MFKLGPIRKMQVATAVQWLNIRQFWRLIELLCVGGINVQPLSSIVLVMSS